jgi:hypothetical protein
LRDEDPEKDREGAVFPGDDENFYDAAGAI